MSAASDQVRALAEAVKILCDCEGIAIRDVVEELARRNACNEVLIPLQFFKAKLEMERMREGK
jgi:hypothetical protein